MTPLIERVAGNPATTTLQHLILNLLVFVGLVTGLYFGVSDWLVGLNPVNSIYDVFLVMLFGVLYWLSRFRGHFALAAHLMALLGLVLCAVNFLINAGIRGPTLMVFLTVLALVTLVHSRVASLAYLAFGLALASGCLAIQSFRPEWIFRYLSTASEFWDITVTFLFCFIVLFAVMRLVLGFFDRVLADSRRAQAQALQSEKMAALGELLANVSHEISTPVGVIGSALEVSREWWVGELPKAARILSSLGPGAETAFWSFVEAGVRAGSSPVVPDTRVLRAQRAALEKDLEAAGVPDPWSHSQDLVLLGIPGWDPAWAPLVSDQAGRDAFDFAVKALVLDRSNRNATRAYGKLQTLIRALRAYSRSEGAGSEPVPTVLSEGLDTVLTLYTASAGTNLEIVREFSEVPPVPGKPDELIQVWTNLVQNALQAMENRGVLTVTLVARPPWAEVTVSDTGPGIPEAIREQVFTPFFTTKRRGVGTGLGLGIVRRIVAEHRGQVTVDDAPGGGARFTVRLPLA